MPKMDATDEEWKQYEQIELKIERLDDLMNELQKRYDEVWDETIKLLDELKEFYIPKE